MTGHVFHPGHSELHGVTVVLEAAGDVVYVGRFHEETEKGVLLHDVAEHRLDAGESNHAAFVARTLKFGVRAQHRHLVVPRAEVGRISRLAEWDER